MDALIEPRIRPVCDALNALPEVRTVYSCGGHYRRAPPFVIFAAPHDVGLAIHRLLGAGHADGRLEYCWSLRAHFIDDLLHFDIESNDRRVVGKKAWPYLVRGHASMRAELLRMAAVLTESNLADAMGGCGKPVTGATLER